MSSNYPDGMSRSDYQHVGEIDWDEDEDEPDEDEITCTGCGVEATPDRLDIGARPDGTSIYLCPVCGADMGETT